MTTYIEKQAAHGISAGYGRQCRVWGPSTCELRREQHKCVTRLCYTQETLCKSHTAKQADTKCNPDKAPHPQPPSRKANLCFGPGVVNLLFWGVLSMTFLMTSFFLVNLHFVLARKEINGWYTVFLFQQKAQSYSSMSEKIRWKLCKQTFSFILFGQHLQKNIDNYSQIHKSVFSNLSFKKREYSTSHENVMDNA